MTADNKSPARPQPTLVWCDLEMTGLVPEDCAIVQMAVVLTDTQLKRLAPPLDMVIWQPESVLERMCPFVRRMHEKSGLLAKVRTSEIAVEDAEREAMKLVTAHAAYRTARLCGNTIGQDRRFLVTYMPTLESYLHYRQLDVSTLKELALFWHGLKFNKPDGGQHTALFDIEQSIAELAFYRDNFIRAKA